MSEEITNRSQSYYEDTVVLPSVLAFKNMLEQVRWEETSRYQKYLEDTQMQCIEKITSGILQKVLNMPVQQLEAATEANEMDHLLTGLSLLFSRDGNSQPG